MPTLEDLLRELRGLGVSPGEISIPYSWFHQMLDQAEERCEGTDENEDAWR